jgi:hypothetical protein
MRQNLPVTSKRIPDRRRRRHHQSHRSGQAYHLLQRGVRRQPAASPAKRSSAKPHNILRHPDMPAEAYRDMWETLQRGRPWSGIVKNRRKNGDFYWVRATATPIADGSGYMSVRIKARREEIASADCPPRPHAPGPGHPPGGGPARPERASVPPSTKACYPAHGLGSTYRPRSIRGPCRTLCLVAGVCRSQCRRTRARSAIGTRCVRSRHRRFSRVAPDNPARNESETAWPTPATLARTRIEADYAQYPEPADCPDRRRRVEPSLRCGHRGCSCAACASPSTRASVPPRPSPPVTCCSPCPQPATTNSAA